jgi:anti-sigma regulatory factor (Ser/Thr protein kinase)
MEDTTSQISLKIFRDRRFVPLVTSFAEKSAEAFSLGREEVLKLTLACEEIFVYLCQAGKGAETITIEASNGVYYTRVKFLFKAHGFSLRSFNLTASVSLDSLASLEEMGLLIASRSVENFCITEDPQEGYALALIKEKSYPESTEIEAPKIKPIKIFTPKIPGPEGLKLFSRLVVAFYPARFPPAFCFPGKIVDMVSSGEFNAAVAMDDGGQIGGGILWRWLGEKLVEFFGPYLFSQPPDTGMAEGLIDACIGQIAKTDAMGLVTRYSTPELPKGYFESSGSVDFIQPDGPIRTSPVYYRQLHEDLGCQVWAHPDLEGFLRIEYNRLFFAREIHLTRHEGEERSPYSVFAPQFDRSHHQVTLRPILEGNDAFNNLSQHVTVLRAEGLMNIFFEIDLGQAWQTSMTPALLGNGFRPRFILPYGGEADVVVFQYQEGK